MVVRLKDIAELMGVSVNTVSRALKDKPDIGEKTRQRIKEAAAALGYRPDLNARAQEIFCAGRSMPAHRKSSAPDAQCPRTGNLLRRKQNRMQPMPVPAFWGIPSRKVPFFLLPSLEKVPPAC